MLFIINIVVVVCARDTRTTSCKAKKKTKEKRFLFICFLASLRDIVERAVVAFGKPQDCFCLLNRRLGGEFIDSGVLTTPQLHHIVRAKNNGFRFCWVPTRSDVL